MRGLLLNILAMLGLRAEALGPRGERIAEAFLKKARYRVLERNARTRIGEADLICEAPDGRTIVIVEVKTRALKQQVAAPVSSGSIDAPSRPDRIIRPEEQVGARKSRKLVLVARDLARRRGWERRPMRIDIVAVEIGENGPPVIRHHLGVVRV